MLSHWVLDFAVHRPDLPLWPAGPKVGLGLWNSIPGTFIVEGLFKIFAAFRYRPHPGWLWMLAGGALSLVLGLLIWNQWPLSGVWAIGILVGVDLLTTGLSLVVLGSAVKSVTQGRSA